jgi:flagella basal body P-ring formation protein FlgA
MKNALITLFLAASLALLAAPASQAAHATQSAKSAGAAPEERTEAVVLREYVEVNSKQVRLGDLFANAGKKADIIVAYAPEPGDRAVFDANWLYRVARSFKLKWRPLSIKERVVVVRKSVVIGHQKIEDAILAALLARGVSEDMSIELSNQMMRIHIASGKPATVEAEDVILNRRTGRFTAILVAPAGSASGQRTRVTGYMFKTIEAPVLASQVPAGEIIKKDDIKWIKMRARRLSKDVILDANELIGKTPRRGRGIGPGTPVRMSEVRRPVLVAKGSLVIIILRSPGMFLTSQGRALENGSAGDSIRVANTRSKTVIDATVTGSGRVSVSPVDRIVMN